MKGRPWQGWLVLLACLVVAGLIRAAIPDYIPEEYDVVADEAGVASQDEVTVQLLDVELADAVVVPSDWDERRLDTEHVFILARVDITAHRKTFITTAELRTADGRSYSFLDLSGFPGARVAHVGSVHTSTFIFEVPEEDLDGAWVGFHGQRPSGLLPVSPVLRFDLDDPPRHGEVELLPDDVRPAR